MPVNQIDWNSLTSSAIGAVIGSVLALIGVWFSHSLQQKALAKTEEKQLLGLLQGVHDELETLIETYMASAGVRLEALPDMQAFAFFYPVSQDYFTIYTNNANLIPRIESHDLRKQVIATYAKAKGLIDTFHLNNELLQKYEHAALLFQETSNVIHQSTAQARFQDLINYAPGLKTRHHELKKMANDLLRDLRKEGVLSR